MAGLVPPAGPKPLRRGEGPAIHVLFCSDHKDVDARHKAGHDEKQKGAIKQKAPAKPGP
jgi:hypothetical protein